MFKVAVELLTFYMIGSESVHEGWASYIPDVSIKSESEATYVLHVCSQFITYVTLLLVCSTAQYVLHRLIFANHEKS